MQKRIFEKQCDFPGGMFSIDFKGGKEPAFEFLRHLRITRNAVSLGGVESLTCHPKSTTHSGMSPLELEESGVTDGRVRISVGVEDWRDLQADFEQALAAVAGHQARGEVPRKSISASEKMGRASSFWGIR